MSNQATAVIVADSLSPDGVRLTTFQLRYWRPIHPELMTHRMWSRNAGSSRARPSITIIESVMDNPWMPIHWGKNQKGMQATKEQFDPVFYPEFMKEPLRHFLNLGPEDQVSLMLSPQKAWHFAGWLAAISAKAFNDAEYHKQVVNRLLEPFTYIDVLVTATDYANWFALRDHPDAQPEIQEVARLMKQLYQENLPRQLHGGEWHLPYITEADWEAAYWKCKEGRITRDEPSYKEKLAIVIKVSAARCARVSYKAFDGNVAPIEKDIELYEQLLVSQPLHASPAEHQATPDRMTDYIITRPEPDYDNPLGIQNKEIEDWMCKELHGNLRGWIQYRKTLPNEYVPG